MISPWPGFEDRPSLVSGGPLFCTVHFHHWGKLENLGMVTLILYYTYPGESPKDLVDFPFQSAHRKSLYLACRITAQHPYSQSKNM